MKSDSLKRDWKSWLVLVPNLIFGVVYLLAYMKYRAMIANLEDLSLYHAPPFIMLILPLVGLIFYNLAKSSAPSLIKKVNFFLEPFFLTLMFGYFAPYLWKGIFFWVVPLVGLILGLHNMQSGLAKDKEKFLAYVEGSAVSDDKIDEVELEPGDFPIGEIYKRNVDETGRTPEGEDAYIPSGKKAVLPIHDRFVHCLVLGVS